MLFIFCLTLQQKKKINNNMEITKELIKERFDVLNYECFDNQIKEPDVIKVIHSVKNAGSVNKDSRTGKIKLYISKDFEFTNATLDDTIAHEMIHLRQFQEFGWKGVKHNKYFKNEMQKLNEMYKLGIGITSKGIPLKDSAKKRKEKAYPKNKLLNKLAKLIDKFI